MKEFAYTFLLGAVVFFAALLALLLYRGCVEFVLS